MCDDDHEFSMVMCQRTEDVCDRPRCPFIKVCRGLIRKDHRVVQRHRPRESNDEARSAHQEHLFQRQEVLNLLSSHMRKKTV